MSRGVDPSTHRAQLAPDGASAWVVAVGRQERV